MRILSTLFVLALLLSSCGKDKDNNNDIAGCMNPESLNYNPEATIDNGSCEFLAPTENRKRNAVLEEFTGVRCTFCPDGHRRANELADANPGRVVLINIHTGSFASPQNGWPDYTNQYGASIATMSNLSGYPAGQMNRHMFEGAQSAAPYYKQKANSMAISRGGFKAAGEYFMEQNAPVNVGISTTFDPSTRKLTVITELYFTEDVQNGALLNLAILENKVIGRQIDMGVDKKDYEHNHMLRTFVTGQWGEEVPGSKTTKGSRYQKTYEFTVSEDWKAENLSVAAYVSKDDRKDILNGVRASFGEKASN